MKSMQALREMVEKSADWPHITIAHNYSNLCMMSAGQLLFETGAYAQRNGAIAHAGGFSFMPKGGNEEMRYRATALAAMIHSLWPQKCDELFGEEFAWSENGVRKTRKDWRDKSYKKMLYAVKKLLQDESLKVHPAVNKLAEGMARHAATLPAPKDLWMSDMRDPLRMAIKKGASRDDLIRMVDEAFAESVMSI